MLQRQESKPRRQDGDPTRALQDDVFLPPGITINPAFDTRQISAPRAILLTGATGFVGAHLLAELLRTTDAALYCTVRDGAETPPMRRLESGAAALPDRAERQPARAFISCRQRRGTRLFADACGLQGVKPRYRLVYHSASAVNFIQPYSYMKRDNVQGLRKSFASRPIPAPNR